MSPKYSFRELRIEINSGIILIADVDSIEAVKSVLAELKGAKLLELREKPPGPGGQRSEHKSAEETPVSRLEVRANLTAGGLGSKNVLAFKDDIPQLLRPTMFGSVVDAALVLLFAVECGLQKQSISYDSFKALYDAQNIKSGTPLSMLLTNLRNGGYVDRRAYESDRTLRLTAKGENKAVEVLSKIVTPA